MSTHPSKMSRVDRWFYYFGKWLLISIGCGVGLLFALALLLYALPIPFTTKALSLTEIRSRQARQILRAIKTHSEIHLKPYPDGKSSNEMLRPIVTAGLAQEYHFGGSGTDYRADRNIGSPPDFQGALEPGECSWAMVRGMSLEDPGHLALIFDAPEDQTWPPVWDPSHGGRPHLRRNEGKLSIVIGRNDGSVAIEKLASHEGTRVPVADASLFSHSPDRLLDPPIAMPEPKVE